MESVSPYVSESAGVAFSTVSSLREKLAWPTALHGPVLFVLLAATIVVATITRWSTAELVVPANTKKGNENSVQT